MKSKLNDAHEARKRVKTLEATNVALRSEHADFETELAKLQAYKPLLDTVRGQLHEAEERAKELLVQESRTEFNTREYIQKVARLEGEARAAHERNQGLEERLREVEEAGGGDGDVAAEGTSLAGELEGSASTVTSAPQQLYFNDFTFFNDIYIGDERCRTWSDNWTNISLDQIRASGSRCWRPCSRIAMN